MKGVYVAGVSPRTHRTPWWSQHHHTTTDPAHSVDAFFTVDMREFDVPLALNVRAATSLRGVLWLTVDAPGARAQRSLAWLQFAQEHLSCRNMVDHLLRESGHADAKSVLLLSEGEQQYVPAARRRRP